MDESLKIVMMRQRRFDPTTVLPVLHPLETRALAKLDEAAALLSEAAGLLAVSVTECAGKPSSLVDYYVATVAGKAAEDVRNGAARLSLGELPPPMGQKKP